MGLDGPSWAEMGFQIGTLILPHAPETTELNGAVGYAEEISFFLCTSLTFPLGSQPPCL